MEWTATDQATIKHFAKKVTELALMFRHGDAALRECHFVVVLKGHEWETVCRALHEISGESLALRRLRAALEVFADEGNWEPDRHGLSPLWTSDTADPWTIAQEALNSEKARGRGNAMDEQDTRGGHIFMAGTQGNFVEVYARGREPRGEVRRLQLALRILAGLPDDAGHTRGAEIGDRGSLYARGVLAGADPGDVEGAIRAGREQR